MIVFLPREKNLHYTFWHFDLTFTIIVLYKIIIFIDLNIKESSSTGQVTSENTENLIHCRYKYIFTVKIRKIKIRILFHQYFINISNSFHFNLFFYSDHFVDLGGIFNWIFTDEFPQLPAPKLWRYSIHLDI